MGTKPGRLTAEEITFAAAAREDTGRHLLDSGGAYGRHHEADPIPEDIDVVKLERTRYGYGIEVTIRTAPFLASWLEIDRQRQARFDEWCEEKAPGDLDWFQRGAVFLSGIEGLTRAGRDNVYNIDNDLDQMYVWEAWTPGDTDEWYHNPETVPVVYLHTGCDVRGGYGRPIFCKTASHGEYPLPMDVVVGYRALRGLDRRGNVLRDRDLRALDDLWSEHYSRWPTGKLQDDTERIFGFTADPEEKTFAALLEGGERVVVSAYAPGPSGMPLK